MKTILRNFVSVIRRFKMATGLNVVGLSVAFAAFIVILIQVNYEQSFDRCHPTADRVFRVDLETTGTFSTILPRGFVEEVIKSSPHIEAGTMICPFIPDVHFTITENGEKKGFRETLQTCHPAVTDVFGFDMVEGDRHCLTAPNNILIPQSMARRFFGDLSATGRNLHTDETMWTSEYHDFTIGGVYRDFPDNTQLKNVIYGSQGDYMKDNFGASNFICYLLLDNATNAQAVKDNFNRTFDFSLIENPDEQVKLIPLTDIYFKTNGGDGRIFRNGNEETSFLLLGIALLIIVIAVINFINFSTALTPLRIKSINTQKVFGSSDEALRRALLSEAIIISLLSWLFSILLIILLNRSALLPFVEADLRLSDNLPIILLSGLIALVTGILAGMYPSRYTVSFPPALVLKGSFGLSPKGRQLRTALIGIQFIIATMLIIGAGFVSLQNDFMRHFSLGFDKDQIAVVELSNDIYFKHHQTYTDRLRTFSGIEDVAFTTEKVGSKDTYSTNTIKYHEQDVQHFSISVSPNFLRVMGIPVEEGRDFTLADEQSRAVYIFNKTARLAAGMKAGEKVESRYNPGPIIGFTGDVKLTSLRQGEDNIAFIVGSLPFPKPVSYIRLKAGTDVHAAVNHIRKTMADIDPTYPFNVEFYDTVFDQLYQKEANLRNLITLFSLLAIVLSLVGVFGLVVFETQYRRKEIGIRKVHGATVGEILAMFNLTYIRIVAVCFVLAAPVAWYGVHKWLENFAYKTPLYWWVFLLAFAIVTTITLATVSIQNWRAAMANPVDSIKTE